MITPTTQLFINGAWVDVTSDTYQGEGLTITRGRADEAATADPASCSLSLDNRSGNYSARNPMSAYYGAIGRNTPLRVLMPSTDDPHMVLSGTTRTVDGTVAVSSCASTPDHSSLDITGNIEIRVEVEPYTWDPSGVFVTAGTTTDDGYGLAQKANADELSWKFWLAPGGYLVFSWSDTGVGAGFEVSSTVPVPLSSGRLAVRVIRTLATGVVRFDTSPSISGSWTQLGSTVVSSAGTSIYSGSADVLVGGGPAYLAPDCGFQGKVYAFELRGASLVTSPDFTAQDTGTTGFTDAQSRVWTLNDAVMANPGARFHGEISSWPTRWDKTGRDVRSPLTAYGLTRRLGRGTRNSSQTTGAPLRSVMHRWLTSDDSPGVVAYWPCEDGDDAEEFASALPDAPPMRHPSGETNNASYDQFKASDPLPTASLVQWTGEVPTYTATGFTQIKFLMAVPSGGVAATADVLRIRAADLVGGGLNAARWDLTLGVGGSLRMEVFNNEDVSVHDTGFVASGLNGKRVLISIEIDDSGTGINTGIRVYQVGVPGVLFQFTANMTNRSFGRVERLAFNVRGIMDDVALGHLSVQTVITEWTAADDDRLVAYKGEVAAARVMRLCREEDVPVIVKGDSGSGALLGPQLAGAFLDLLREAADSDLGVLYEAREALALAYRTRESMYAQEATLTLDYEARTVSEIEPTEDDDATRNDITVTRVFGGSARVEDTDSALSVNAPPSGVGRYEEEVTISLSRDDELAAQASWRLHLGTVDEARYPVIGVNLARSVFTSDAALTEAAVVLDVGDRIVVSNPPTGVGAPEDIQQITQGFTETFTGPEWLLDMNCTPASPWDVGVWDDDDGPGEARYSTLGTFLTADVPSSGTALVLNGVSPGRASTTDKAALDITGDLDVRVHVAMDDWTPAANSTLCSKWTGSGNQRSWAFLVTTTGVLRFQWTTGGVTTITADSTVAPTVTNGAALWVRATIDVNNGAAGRDIRFYTSTDGDTWTQLGTTVTQAGTTSIHSGSAELIVSGIDGGTSSRLSGKVSAMELRNGILGTRVARPEFGAQAAGTTSFADAQGNTWTITSPAVISSAANTLFPGTLFVSTPTGPVWSAADAPFDLVLGGERVTLTALTGTSTAQVLQVTRAVNGVNKGHATGAEVGLFKPAIAAL